MFRTRASCVFTSASSAARSRSSAGFLFRRRLVNPVIREHERARLKRLLAELPPGNLSDEEAERLADEVRHEVGEPG